MWRGEAKRGEPGHGKARVMSITLKGSFEAGKRCMQKKLRPGRAGQGGAWPGPARPGKARELEHLSKLLSLRLASVVCRRS